jgi:hypothetical protein
MGPPIDRPGRERPWTPTERMQNRALTFVGLFTCAVYGGGLLLALVGKMDANRWFELVGATVTSFGGFAFGYLFRDRGGHIGQVPSASPRRPRRRSDTNHNHQRGE